MENTETLSEVQEELEYLTTENIGIRIEDCRKFVWYESFTSQVSHFLLSEQRMIDHYDLGAFEEQVVEYKVVDGEYVVTRELTWIAG